MTGRPISQVRTLARAASSATRSATRPATRPVIRPAIRPTSGRFLLVLGAAWSALTVLLSVLTRPADCVHASGLSGFIATNLAQMRTVAECPTGTLGYGPHTMTAVAAGSALLASLVIAHLAAGVLAHWLSRAAGAVHALVAGLLQAPPRLERAWHTPTSGETTDWRASAVVHTFCEHSLWERGPPQRA